MQLFCQCMHCISNTPHSLIATRADLCVMLLITVKCVTFAMMQASPVHAVYLPAAAAPAAAAPPAAAELALDAPESAAAEAAASAASLYTGCTTSFSGTLYTTAFGGGVAAGTTTYCTLGGGGGGLLGGGGGGLFFATYTTLTCRPHRQRSQGLLLCPTEHGTLWATKPDF